MITFAAVVKGVVAGVLTYGIADEIIVPGGKALAAALGF